ncbi:hypothetical protein BSY19_2677 [Bosea sp. RAC05]|nr:hypothetical protein BSY19_2677 [Bosea sp. RAC05]
MTAELSIAERREMPDQIDSLNQRAAAKAREIEAAERQIDDLSADIAAGKAGAKASALKLAALVSETAIERNAIVNTMSKLQARWDADGPFRQSLADAERRKRCLAAVAVSVEKAVAVDQAARDFVAAIVAHQESLNEPVTNGIEPNVAFQLAPQFWFDHVLVAAGARKFRPDLQAQPGGPNTLEEHTRERLRL